MKAIILPKATDKLSGNEIVTVRNTVRDIHGNAGIWTTDGRFFPASRVADFASLAV